MGQLIDSLQAMGYVFAEGSPLAALGGRAGPAVRQLRVTSPKGQTMAIARDQTPVLFPGDTDGIPENDFTGEDGIRTANGDIYRDYYALNGDEYSLLLHGYSLRTKEYLDAQKAQVGLTDVKEDTPTAFFVLDEFRLGRGQGLIETGRYADGRFVAQSASPRQGGEVVRMHFNHLPDKQDTEAALAIHKLEKDFASGRRSEWLHCAQCGKQVHWLDAQGNLAQRVQLLNAKSCGCQPQED